MFSLRCSAAVSHRCASSCIVAVTLQQQPCFKLFPFCERYGWCIGVYACVLMCVRFLRTQSRAAQPLEKQLLSCTATIHQSAQQYTQQQKRQQPRFKPLSSRQARHLTCVCGVQQEIQITPPHSRIQRKDSTHTVEPHELNTGT